MFIYKKHIYKKPKPQIEKMQNKEETFEPFLVILGHFG